MTTPNQDCWILVIETDEYAGNFERELCAWLTGSVGECGVGRGIEPALDLSEQTLDIPDDHGCYRSCSIWCSGDEYDSVAIFFEEKISGQDFVAITELLKDIPYKTFRTSVPEFKVKSVQLIKYEIKTTETVWMTKSI